MSQIAVDPPRRHRLSVADYYRMAEVGILAPDARVELIDGEIIDMPPIGSRHAGTVDRLNRILQAAVDDRGIVRTQGPIRLDRYSEPQPDVSVLRPSGNFYTSAHPGPGDVLLVVEVSATSARFDRDTKVPLYSRHGVPEVWLVDIEARRLTRYRNPVRGTYTLVDEPGLATPLAVAGVPNVLAKLDTLFAY